MRRILIKNVLLLKTCILLIHFQGSWMLPSAQERRFLRDLQQATTVVTATTVTPPVAHSDTLSSQLLHAAMAHRHLEQEQSFNLTAFSFKYIGCQNVQTYSDYYAAAAMENYNDNTNVEPVVQQHYVIFRLCESQSCGMYNRMGCHSNYGEYMLPMSEYLNILYKYHIHQVENYCNICYKCMTYSQQQDDDNNGGDDDAAKDDDDYQQAQAYNMYNDDFYADDVVEEDDEENEQEDDTPYYINAYGTCRFDSVCSNYEELCANVNMNNDDNNDDNNQNDVSNFFTCGQQQGTDDDGAMPYIGPHCAEDGYTIELAQFSDEYCYHYQASTEDQPYQSMTLQEYTEQYCIECGITDDNPYAMFTDDQLEDDTVNPVCEYLYETSAKCHQNMKDEETVDTSNDETVCPLISSLLSNSYNEFGNAVAVPLFTGPEIACLVLGIMICISLLGYIVWLRREMSMVRLKYKHGALLTPSAMPFEKTSSFAYSVAGDTVGSGDGSQTGGKDKDRVPRSDASVSRSVRSFRSVSGRSKTSRSFRKKSQDKKLTITT